LFCRRGSLKAHGRVGGTWFNWKRPYDERGKPRHSAKPGNFITMVEEVSPGPYLEMFARENRPGWDAWGNECESIVLTPTIKAPEPFIYCCDFCHGPGCPACDPKAPPVTCTTKEE
jgi:hypothetical protein